MIKALLVIILIAVAGGLLVNYIPVLKEHVVEVINPSIKEGRVLGELSTNLDSLDNIISSLNNLKDAAKIQKTKDLLAKSKALLSDASSLNKKSSGITGIISQQIGNMINALTDKTPYPADHLQTSSTSPIPSCSK